MKTARAYVLIFTSKYHRLYKDQSSETKDQRSNLRYVVRLGEEGLGLRLLASAASPSSAIRSVLLELPANQPFLGNYLCQRLEKNKTPILAHYLHSDW